MNIAILTVSVILFLDILLIVFMIVRGRDNELSDDDFEDLYDMNGNHIYYDRKLIASLDRQKGEEETKRQSATTKIQIKQ